MKRGQLLLFTLIAIGFWSSCQKNVVSKIPSIKLTGSTDSISAKKADTCFIKFSFTDGDGDIGYGTSGGQADTVSAIFIRDSRYATLPFTQYYFPPIDTRIEDPKYGLQGDCLFYPSPPPTPRPDSLHTATGDTLFYEFYITDRAGNQSNHVTTHALIMRP